MGSLFKIAKLENPPMIEFFSNLPMMFYYGAAASAVIILIMSILFRMIVDGEFVWGVVLTFYFPITIVIIACVMIYVAIDAIVDIFDGYKNNVPFYEEKNKEYLICNDMQLIIDDVTAVDVLKIYHILHEHDMEVTINPTIPWHIFPSKRRVFRNEEPSSYKIFFASIEDKATFQFYWESIKNE
jgi:hypothetical protein